MLPIKIIKGNINKDDAIFDKNVDIGKILIDEDHPFALIKITSKNFNFNTMYTTNSATLKIIKPNWLNLSWQNLNKSKQSANYLIISNKC